MFFDLMLQSLWRHKTRSFLTTLGIIIAIAAIVALGSISEGIGKLVDEQLKLASDLIIVTEAGMAETGSGASSFGAESKVERSRVDEIRQIYGVKDAILQVRSIDPKSSLYVVGVSLEALEYFDLQNIEFVEGGWPEEGEKSAAFGNKVSELSGYKVGDEVTIGEDKYAVSGVLESMGNFLDYGVITSLDAAVETFDFDDYVSAIVVEPEDVKDSKRIANEIEDLYDDLDAMTGEEAIDRAREAVDQVRMMTLSVGIIASIVASIGIINTMVMMVFERRNEFGVMKALGAQRKTILMLVMQESIALGIIGSVIGMAIGFIGTEAINGASGFPIASVTPTLAIASLVYGVLLCVLAAAYPAYQAINVNPIDAMREQ